MPDYIQIEPGLVVDEDGEIIEGGHHGLKRVVEMRHYAKENEDAWAARRKALDSVVRKKQEGDRAVYGDIVSSIRRGSFGRLDSDKLVQVILQQHCPPEEKDDWTDDDGNWLLIPLNAFELDQVDLLILIGCATGFRKEKDRDDPTKAYLPVDMAGWVDKATNKFEKQPWIATERLVDAPPKPSKVVR